MKALRLAAGIGIGIALLPACSADVQGELVLVLQTDLAMPKDIDRIRLEVTYVKTGAYAYQKDFNKLASSDSIRLPATLGFTAPADPSEAIKIRALAGRGAEEETRLLFEMITTVPTDRRAMLRVPIEFLCDGSATPERDMAGQIRRDPSGRVLIKNACPDGLTCVVGTCVTNEVSSDSLPDFDEAAIFGGGTGNGDGSCFDTARCFEGATDAKLDLTTFGGDMTTCRAAGGGDINVALRTEGPGMCNSSGCFVALDAESDSGWRQGADSWITLPVAVCAQVASGKILGVATAPASAGGACPQKLVSLPPCGRGSSAGDGQYTIPSPDDPTLIAPGQVRPVSFALTADSVYWTSSGTFDEKGDPRADGRVKLTPLDGGQPVIIAEGQGSPHDIAVDEARRFVLWTNASGGEIMWAPFDAPSGASLAAPLLPGRLQPEGIAVGSSSVYWTELANSTIYTVETQPNGNSLEIVPGKSPVKIPGSTPAGSFPRDIAAAKNAVCWTYEDQLMTSGGLIACRLANATVVIAEGQRTPRAIAMSVDSGGFASAVYWVNFDAAEPTPPSLVGGGVFRVSLSGGSPGAVETIAQEDYPGGIAVDADGKTIYWTSRSRGMVTSWSEGDAQPKVRARDQQSPGAIAVNAAAIYWINEGTSALTGGAVPDGAILRIAK